MSKQQAPTPTQSEVEARRKKRADSFWNIFLPTKDGKVKSTLIVNSFCFSILCLGIYILAYLLLIDALHGALAEAPVWLSNLASSLLPGLLGTAVCCAFHFLFREKKIVPAAYAWQLVYAVGAILWLLISLPAGDRAFAANLMLMVVPVPLLSGCALSAYLYVQHKKKLPAEPAEEPPPWKQKKAR